jgi:hypothetical protein
LPQKIRFFDTHSPPQAIIKYYNISTRYIDYARTPVGSIAARMPEVPERVPVQPARVASEREKR